MKDLSVRMRESAIPEIFLLALKNDKEKNAQDYNEKVLKMNKEKIQNFRISFFDSPLGFQTDTKQQLIPYLVMVLSS